MDPYCVDTLVTWCVARVLTESAVKKSPEDVGKIAVMEEEPELIQPDEVTVSKGIMLDQSTPYGQCYKLLIEYR